MTDLKNIIKHKTNNIIEHKTNSCPLMFVAQSGHSVRPISVTGPLGLSGVISLWALLSGVISLYMGVSQFGLDGVISI